MALGSIGAPASSGDGRRLPLVLGLLTVDVFIANTVAFMLAPLLVPIAAELGTTVGVVGQLAAITSIPWAVAGFFAGPVSDRWGRRRLLLGGNALVGLGTVLSGLASSYPALLATRLLTGLGASAIGPNCLSLVGDLVPPSRRGKALGWVMSGQSLAPIIGVPAVSAIAGSFGWRAGFWAVGGMVLILCLAQIAWLPGATQPGGPPVSYLRSFAQVLRNRTAMVMSIANLLERIAYGIFSVYFAAFLIQSYDLDLREVAPILSVIALGMLTGTLVSGRLTDRLPKRPFAVVAPVIEGLIILPLFLFAPGLIASAALGFLAGASSASTRPIFMWLGTNAAPRLRGTLAGFTVVSNQAGVILGSAIGGLLLGSGTYTWLGATAGIVAGLTALLLIEPDVVES
ncbi:MAG TPA: MFS transporter [Dehalococcoidia bacterium]|nr:MFS transporter [Dehalococcoidia bacterium]